VKRTFTATIQLTLSEADFLPAEIETATEEEIETLIRARFGKPMNWPYVKSDMIADMCVLDVKEEKDV
jgi:hypothetical protein